MKIYLVKRKNTNIKWFESKDQLVEFLGELGPNPSDYIITELVAETQSIVSAGELIEQVKEQAKLETQIGAVLGDEYSLQAKKLVELFIRLAPKSAKNPKQLRPTGLKILDQLQATLAHKESFSGVVKKNSEYILYNVSASVEWYTAVLAVYGFRKLAPTCRTEYSDPLTGGSLWRGARTPQVMLKNFQQAKTN